ncbi:hypothetical protein PFICI_08568 [Pestalotiopsis fici W106-1]|uniref:Beta-glucuronidase C-terminal domain-containing protein n=1 Tax=Pestalotiopsis fici (strain W106-1 / CGMCC3.15140) TaxID=1229662 RepID=W3WY01_PESFW|nr:uncharacterized protein PFICI_08568 [Pestalotiopsis fici W106-1]ETS78715.1 hypothetical protein PFICI_08568 [Pestalotiopsis fici W106-1]
MSLLCNKLMHWCLALAAATCVRALELELSLEMPDTALPLPASMCGLSIEADRFVDWAGEPGKANQFTWNLMNNTKEKTGIAPPIRIGGGSQDFIINVADLDNEEPGFYNIFAPVPELDDLESTKQLFPQAYFTGAGYKYWRAACNFPPTTSFTFGVNFLAGNTSEAIAQIKNIEKAFAESDCSDVELYAIELGNEADQWDDGVKRDEDWDIYAYSAQQISYYEAINDTLGDNGRKYRFGDSASRWSVKNMLNTDALQGEFASSINSLSVHHYHSTGQLDSRSVWPGKASGLVNKTSIRTELDSYDDSVKLAADANYSFVLGETGSFASHGQQGVSNSAAAALWLVDYSLHAAVVGISGLFFHQGVGYNYSAFEPVDHIGINLTDYAPDATHYTMPEYYGYVVVGEAIGSKEAYINEIEVDSSVPLTAFEIYEDNNLKRIVLINSQPWTELSTGERQNLTIQLPQLEYYDGARYKLLEFESLSATSGLTWGGQSYETLSGKASGEKVFHELDSSGAISLPSSSVALIHL